MTNSVFKIDGPNMCLSKRDVVTGRLPEPFVFPSIEDVDVSALPLKTQDEAAAFLEEKLLELSKQTEPNLYLVGCAHTAERRRMLGLPGTV